MFENKFLKRKNDITLIQNQSFHSCACYFYQFDVTNESLCKDVYDMMQIER